MAGPMPAGRGRGGRFSPAPLRLNWRLYRLCLAPVIAALLAGAFSLGNPPPPIGSSLLPESFEGSHALATLREMAALAPSHRPGSIGDARLLQYLQGQLRSLGSTSSGGYEVHVANLDGATSWGSVPQPLLVGRRAGTATLPPIAVIAARDSASGGQAGLSGAAALLEVAAALAQSVTRHPVYVIFSDGGSGGGTALASWLQAHLGGRLDAAIVLGDLAGAKLRRPLVQAFSTSAGQAPEELSATVSAALASQLGASPGVPSLGSQLAHLAFPLTVGEQGELNAIGIPSVGVSLAGERGPSAGESVSQTRLEAGVRAVLSSVYTLDQGPEVVRGAATGLRLSGRLLPEWSIALIGFALLLGPASLAIDALVRHSRRRQPIGRWMLMLAVCACPFLAAAITLKLFTAIGALSAPPDPVGAAALSFGIGSITAFALSATALILGARALWRLRSKGGVPRAPQSEVAGAAALGGGCLLALIVWSIDPYTALLALPALHLWPHAISARRPRRRVPLLALVLAPPLAPLALLAAFYCVSLGLGPFQAVLEGMLLIGGGFVGLGGTLLWSLACGSIVAMVYATIGMSGRAPLEADAPAGATIPVLYERAPQRRERVLR